MDVPLENADAVARSRVEGSVDLRDASQLRSRITRGESGTLETEQGTLYISKPYRSKTTKKLRAMVTFAPRTSHFDLSNAASGQDEFRVSFVSPNYVFSLLRTGIFHTVLDIHVHSHRPDICY
jgi:hypothetical protein